MMRMEKAVNLEQTSHGRSQQHKLSTSTGVGHKSLHKHWEWQEERSPMLKHGSVIRPTMLMASLDIKTAFDEARPRQIARSMEGLNMHGWLIAALLREISRLEGKAMFECVESSFNFNRCLCQGSAEAHRLWPMMAAQLWKESGNRKRVSLVGLQRD